MPGTTGTPLADTCAFARILSPITSSARSPGPMKTMPASAHARGEVGVLGEEPVAGVDRLRAGLASGGEDRRRCRGRTARRGGRPDPDGGVGLAHVRRLGVGVAVDGDRADAEAPQGADDAAGDLAAVGDEDGVEHSTGSGLRDVACGSHPEEAEARLGQRGARDDVEREAEQVAGVGGVDDAVVPQARGRVVRVALLLVLRADRRLELGLLLGSTTPRRGPRAGRA